MIAFDCDGTLASCGGIVESRHLNRLAFWGIVSSRSIGRQREALGSLKPHFMIVCRVKQRAEELRALANEYSNHDRKIYVADTENDRQEAILAGWEFMTPKEFIEWNSKLTSTN